MIPEPDMPENTVRNTTKKIIARAVIRAGDFLGLSYGEQAAILGLSAEDMSGSEKENAVLSPDTEFSERAVLLIRLFSALNRITGDDCEAMTGWIRSHNLVLNAVPAEEILTVSGLSRTVDYVEASEMH